MQLQAADKSADEQNFDKMKAAYDACLDEDKLKSIGSKPLLKVLDDVKSAHSKSTKDAILLLAKYEVSALIASGTGADDRDPDTVVVSIAPPWNLGLPSKERYEDDKLVEKYRGVAVQVLGSLYPDVDKTVFSKVIELEKKLAAASPSTQEREDVEVSLPSSNSCIAC